MYTYKAADYFGVDDLLTDEHKIVRSAIRDWVNKSVVPVIEDAAHKHKFPIHMMKELGELGAFGPFIPEEYGGAGMDHIAYGVIMTELDVPVASPLQWSK